MWRPLLVHRADRRDELQEKLAAIRYSMLIHGDKVTVQIRRRNDYSAIGPRQPVRTVQEPQHPGGKKSEDKKPDTSLSHVEEGILEFVGDLYPEISSSWKPT